MKRPSEVRVGVFLWGRTFSRTLVFPTVPRNGALPDFSPEPGSDFAEMAKAIGELEGSLTQAGAAAPSRVQVYARDFARRLERAGAVLRWHKCSGR